MVGRTLERVVCVAEAAWRASLARRLWSGIWPAGAPRTHVGVVVAAASASALVLQRFAIAPMPLTWILPATGLALGVTLAAGGE